MLYLCRKVHNHRSFEGSRCLHFQDRAAYPEETDTKILLCILYNQRDATYAMSFIIISALHVSEGFSAHHQELIKLYVQP